MQKLTDLILEKPYLAWHVRDKHKLSPESALEHILNYGNWNDYLSAESLLGLKNTKAIFVKLTKKKRVNLRPQTANYFKLYFQKYA